MYCGDHLHIIQPGLQGNPEFRKNNSPLGYACGNETDLPHVAKHAFGSQMGPNMQKVIQLGSPPHQGLGGLSQKIFSDLFLGSPGCFPRFLRCWPYFVAGILFDGSSRT